MIHQLYILIIIVITAIVIFYYYSQEQDYKREIDRISRIEDKYKRESDELDFIRTQTTPCQIGDFKTPRSCYYDSGYACSWNDLAKRCDMKK
jgi:hypothetical protein